MNFKLFIFILSSIFFLYNSITAFAFGPERRQDQFGSTQGYLVLPAPYAFPGLGEGMMLIGYGGNILESTVDAYLVAFTGDAEGYFSSVEEIFLLPETLHISGMRGHIKKYAINMYRSRGMDSEKDNFNLMVGDKYVLNKIQSSLSLLDRRIELSYYTQNQTGRSTEIRDYKGENPIVLDNPAVFQSTNNGLILNLDWTDDYKDPRDGVRLRSTYDKVTSVDVGTPEYSVLSYGLTYYVPVLANSTWAFHYFRSDAQVQKQGYTDLKTVLMSNGLSSTDADTCVLYPTIAACSAQINNANNKIKANSNGSAHPLGGQDRLRSYPNGRYQAAHTQFYGTELRWNFDTSKDEVDLFFFSDVIDALQGTVFLEQGSVSEEAADLGKINRSTYGLGLRFVGGSGNVYRFETSTGDEGAEVLLMFQYPWSGEMS